MDIWHCLKEQRKDKIHLLLGSKDINCLLGIKMKDLYVLPEVKNPIYLLETSASRSSSFPNGICFQICACLKRCETELIIKINDLNHKPTQVTKAKVTQHCTDPEIPTRKSSLIYHVRELGGKVPSRYTPDAEENLTWDLTSWLMRSSPATFTTNPFYSISRVDKSRQYLC